MELQRKDKHFWSKNFRTLFEMSPNRYLSSVSKSWIKNSGRSTLLHHSRPNCFPNKWSRNKVTVMTVSKCSKYSLEKQKSQIDFVTNFGHKERNWPAWGTKDQDYSKTQYCTDVLSVNHIEFQWIVKYEVTRLLFLCQEVKSLVKKRWASSWDSMYLFLSSSVLHARDMLGIGRSWLWRQALWMMLNYCILF